MYLDDDSANALLVQLLSKAGHDVVVPRDVGNSGQSDPAHFLYAIIENWLLLTQNHDDFELLHQLVIQAKGHHPGIFVVRKDNDPTRNLTPKGISRAVRRILAAGQPLEDELNVLNFWR